MATKNSNKSSSTGIGFVGLLTILFVALKLTHNIAWSWWWVLAPLWISALGIIGITTLGIIICVYFDKG